MAKAYLQIGSRRWSVKEVVPDRHDKKLAHVTIGKLITRAIEPTRKASFSDAVRYMMEHCDKHGLHHEVLEEFMKSFRKAFEANEVLCRMGKPQLPLDFYDMANEALWEWDI